MLSLNYLAAFLLIAGAVAVFVSWHRRRTPGDQFRGIGFLCLAAALIARELDAQPSISSALTICAAIAILYGAIQKLKSSRRPR
jgi:hypothetical protein